MKDIKGRKKYIYIYIYVCVYVCIYIYIYIYMCVCVCVREKATDHLESFPVRRCNGETHRDRPPRLNTEGKKTRKEGSEGRK
jgi:hypothetical protein